MVVVNSQNNLSDTYLRNIYTKENLELINPQLITLLYLMPAELDQFFYVSMWSAMMTL